MHPSEYKSKSESKLQRHQGIPDCTCTPQGSLWNQINDGKECPMCHNLVRYVKEPSLNAEPPSKEQSAINAQLIFANTLLKSYQDRIDACMQGMQQCNKLKKTIQVNHKGKPSGYEVDYNYQKIQGQYFAHLVEFNVLVEAMKNINMLLEFVK